MLIDCDRCDATGIEWDECLILGPISYECYKCKGKKKINMTKDVALYLDMDGVFTDFVSSAHKLFKDFHLMQGLYSDEIKSDQHKVLRARMVEALTNKKDFWHTLPWTSTGKELYQFVLNNFDTEKVAMLTAPMSSDPNCKDGKRAWLAREMPEIKSIIIDDLKWNHVNNITAEYQILVDDRPKNINKWIEHGGIGILHDHTNVEQTFEQLSLYV